MRKLGPVLVLLACLVLARPAHAQLPTPYPGVDVPNYAAIIAQDTFLRQSLGQPGTSARAPSAKERKRARRKAKKDPKPTARQRATLRFGSTSEVSAEVDRFFLENFAAPGVAPEIVVADLGRLRSLGLQDMERIGWRTVHLGDVAAFSLLAGYMVVNQEPKANGKGAEVMRRAIVDELALMKSVRRLSDARQQELGELLMLRIAYYAGWRNDLMVRGDQAGADEITERLRRYIETVYGVDVSELRLGSRGFRKR